MNKASPEHKKKVKLLQIFTFIPLIVLTAIALVVSPFVVSAETMTTTTFYTANLTSLNSSGATGMAYLEVSDNTLKVLLLGHGLDKDHAHAQKIYGLANNANSTCPTDTKLDTNSDGIISLDESASKIGPVELSLESFPVADSGGNTMFYKTFSLPSNIQLENKVVLMQGLTKNGDYDSMIPVSCGHIEKIGSVETALGVTPTLTPTLTPVISSIPCVTTSVSPTVTGTFTPTPSTTPTATQTTSPTVTVTATGSPTVTSTPSPTPSSTPTSTPTETVTTTPTETPVGTTTPSVTPTTSITPSTTTSPTVSTSPTTTMGLTSVSETPCVSPTATSTPTVTPTSTLMPTGTITTTPSMTPGIHPDSYYKQIFMTMLSGAKEVPYVSTATKGTAVFKVNPIEREIDFSVDVENGEAITAAHLHCAPVGQNGPVVVDLFEDLNGRNVNGELVSGTLKESDILAAGMQCGPNIKTMPHLVQAMREGQIYINIHTKSNPDGLIRGQIMM